MRSSEAGMAKAQRAIQRAGDASPVPERSPQQAAGEAAFMQVHETIVNIEAALSRAERALKTLSKKDNPYPYLAAAMERAVADLDLVRRRLMQGTYWAMDERAVYDVVEPSAPGAEQVHLFDFGPAEDPLP